MLKGNEMIYHIVVDDPLPESVTTMLGENITCCQWSDIADGDERLRTIDAFLTYGHLPVDGAMMDAMPNLKVISNFGVGVDHIDLDAARTRGLPVGNTPNILDGAVADMTFALLMTAARNIVVGDRYARSPAFIHYDPSILHGCEIHGSTLGIIGMGNIGRQVARRAQGFDMTILYHNRKPNPEAEEELGATWVSLDKLLTTSDYVTLNMPLTPETRHIIGRDELQRMKPTAILVNMARGGVIDHEALIEALEEKWIAAAAVDVTEPEPLPRNHPLLSMDNLVIAPHLGSATTQTRHAMARLTIDNLMAGLAGKPLPSPV